MKRLLIMGDLHFSNYSSILRHRDEKFSNRILNMFDTLNFVAETFNNSQCDTFIGLGDFFDSAAPNCEEITAFTNIVSTLNSRNDNFSKCKKLFLCGNHEMGANSHDFTSASLLSMFNNAQIISSPISIIENNCEVCFLPYVDFNSQKYSLSAFFGNKFNKRIIFSHNDICGIQYGSFVSKTGFELEDIKSNCDLFINGHLHNSATIDNIINVGNITGQNFSEDASKYRHSLMILDLASNESTRIENPFAYNFYKFDFTDENSKTKNRIQVFSTYLKDTNAVLSIVCNESNAEFVKQAFETFKDKRIVIKYDKKDNVDMSELINISDHFKLFSDYVLKNFPGVPYAEEELQNVMQG